MTSECKRSPQNFLICNTVMSWCLYRRYCMYVCMYGLCHTNQIEATILSCKVIHQWVFPAWPVLRGGPLEKTGGGWKFLVQEFYFKDQLVCRIFFPGLQAWQEFFFHTGKSLLFVINVFSQRFLPWIKRALIVSMPALNIHVDTTLNLVGGKVQLGTCKKNVL